jgi:glyoxylase-like metal-dependent hydrolase (beta-lactamase superfamily II)
VEHLDRAPRGGRDHGPARGTEALGANRLLAAMRIHHLNCGTMCPRSARLFNGEGGWLAPAKLICHCLLIEADDGLLLVDTGFGSGDARDPQQFGRLFSLMGAKLEIGETAIRQIEGLGFAAADVRHIIITHLDSDHSGGLPDFPQAEVHVFAPELEAALHPALRDRTRYFEGHWKHGPRWVRHEAEGEEWLGFESVRVLPDLDAEVLLVPLVGHSLGHAGVAVKTDDGWLLHCGDAYHHHDVVANPPRCPLGLRFFQRLVAADNGQRIANQERLRELANGPRDDVRLICSHDPHELQLAQAVAAATA